jgi:hypothetical protein
VPFENNSNFGVGPSDNYQNVLNIKPVIPTSFGKNWNLINRGIQPIIAQDGLAPGQDSEFGVGDFTYQGFFSPKVAGKIIWGIGPQLGVPLGDQAFTTDKWTAGPSAVVLAMPGKWVFGSVISQVWDYAGKGSAADVSLLTWQYFINYNFGKGWFASSAPTMTANWKAQRDSDRWTIPVGGGGGRVMKLGKHHVKLSGQVFAYVTSPDAVDTDWTAQLSFILLLPKGK